MRTIKFRGKRVDNWEWVYGYYSVVNINHGIWARFESQFPQWYQVHSETVGQFTGLHDKNGKEIFESDVVMHKYKRIWQTDYHKSVVVWNQEWCCFYLFDGISNHRMRDDIEYEVIGNIHENKELLK